MKILMSLSKLYNVSENYVASYTDIKPGDTVVAYDGFEFGDRAPKESRRYDADTGSIVDDSWDAAVPVQHIFCEDEAAASVMKLITDAEGSNVSHLEEGVILVKATGPYGGAYLIVDNSVIYVPDADEAAKAVPPYNGADKAVAKLYEISESYL